MALHSGNDERHPGSGGLRGGNKGTTGAETKPRHTLSETTTHGMVASAHEEGLSLMSRGEVSEVTLTATQTVAAPLLLPTSSSFSAQEGDDVIVSVPLAPHSGVPTHITWARGDVELAGERFNSVTERGAVTLNVRNAAVNDSGRYFLSARNDAGHAHSDLLLEVRTRPGDVPVFLRRLNDLAVKVGTRTRFLVEIRSPTQVKVSWEQEGKPVVESERFHLLHEGNFFCVDVAPLTLEDAGLWICRAHNSNGTATCFCHLNVLVPKAYKAPHFIEELVAILTEQGTVSLECKVVGVPTPTLRWFKDNKEIKAGDVFALSANPQDATSLGTYTCEATNCMGRAYSTSRVHVMSKEGSVQPDDSLVPKGPAPVFSKELRNEKVKIGGKLTLSCKVNVPPWPKNITWFNKEGLVESGGRYHVIEDGLGAYSVEVEPVEAGDEGEWKCVATSDHGVKGLTTCNVTVSYPKNYKKPKFLESLKAILTEEGLVSFECKVVGYPTPQLRWFKDGQELKPGDVYQLTGTNSLGSYCCIAKNCMGETSSTAELTVEDIQSQLNEEERLQLFSKNQPPKFLQGLKSLEAKILDPLRFTVQVSVSPQPSVAWYRDDEEVQESDKYKKEQETKGFCHLSIKRLELMDQAEWKCVATNDYGQSVTSCFLKLAVPRHYKKPRFLENLRAVLSEEGAVNLECKVIGVPQPTLKWYKDGRELKPGDIHRIISGQDGTCCLGTYTCEATNCMGTVASSASLLGFEDKAQVKPQSEPLRPLPPPAAHLVRHPSLSTIQEERTSQLHDTVTSDERAEVSFSFDGKEVSVSLYETPDLTEEEALQVVEMYAEELSEHISEHNVVELPPMRFVKETSQSGHLLMEAVVIDVSPEYYASAEDRTEADLDEFSITEDNGFMSPQVLTPEEMPFEKFTADFLDRTDQLGQKAVPIKPPRKRGADNSESSYHSLKEAKLSPEEESSEFVDALSSIKDKSQKDSYSSAKTGSGQLGEKSTGKNEMEQESRKAETLLLQENDSKLPDNRKLRKKSRSRSRSAEIQSIENVSDTASEKRGSKRPLKKKKSTDSEKEDDSLREFERQKSLKVEGDQGKEIGSLQQKGKVKKTKSSESEKEDDSLKEFESRKSFHSFDKDRENKTMITSKLLKKKQTSDSSGKEDDSLIEYEKKKVSSDGVSEKTSLKSEKQERQKAPFSKSISTDSSEKDEAFAIKSEQSEQSRKRKKRSIKKSSSTEKKTETPETGVEIPPSSEAESCDHDSLKNKKVISTSDLERMRSTSDLDSIGDKSRAQEEEEHSVDFDTAEDSAYDKSEMSVLESLTHSIKEIQKGLAAVEERVISESTGEPQSAKSSLSVIESLVQPINEIQRGLVEVEKLAEETEAGQYSPSSILETLKEPLQELGRNLAVIENTKTAESGDESLLKRTTQTLLETVSHPLHDLQKELSFIQQQAIIETGEETYSDVLQSFKPSLLVVEGGVEQSEGDFTSKVEDLSDVTVMPQGTYAQQTEETPRSLDEIRDQQSLVGQQNDLFVPSTVQDLEESLAETAVSLTPLGAFDLHSELQMLSEKLEKCFRVLNKNAELSTDDEVKDILSSLGKLVTPLEQFKSVTEKCLKLVVENEKSNDPQIRSSNMVLKATLESPVHALGKCLNLLETVANSKSNKEIRGLGIKILYKLSFPLEELKTTMKLIENLSEHTSIELLLGPVENLISAASVINLEASKSGFAENIPEEGGFIVRELEDAVGALSNSVVSITKVLTSQCSLRTLSSLTKPLADFQRNLHKIEKKIKTQEKYNMVTTSEIYNLAQDLCKPLQAIRTELSIAQHEIELDQYSHLSLLSDSIQDDTLESATNIIHQSLEQMHKSVLTCTEFVFSKSPSEKLFVRYLLFALNELILPLNQLNGCVLKAGELISREIQQTPETNIGISAVTSSTSELLSVLSELRHHALTSVGHPEIQMVQLLCTMEEPLAQVEVGLCKIIQHTHEEDKNILNIQMLKTLAEPFKCLQKSLINIYEKLGSESISQGIFLELRHPIQELQRSILIIQDQVSFEYGDEPASMESNIVTLQSLINPLNALKKQFLDLENLIIDRTHSTSYSKENRNLHSIIKINHELQLKLSSIMVEENYLNKHSLDSLDMFPIFQDLNNLLRDFENALRRVDLVCQNETKPDIIVYNKLCEAVRSFTCEATDFQNRILLASNKANNDIKHPIHILKRGTETFITKFYEITADLENCKLDETTLISCSIKFYQNLLHNFKEFSEFINEMEKVNEAKDSPEMSLLSSSDTIKDVNTIMEEVTQTRVSIESINILSSKRTVQERARREIKTFCELLKSAEDSIIDNTVTKANSLSFDKEEERRTLLNTFGSMIEQLNKLETFVFGNQEAVESVNILKNTIEVIQEHLKSGVEISEVYILQSLSTPLNKFKDNIAKAIDTLSVRTEEITSVSSYLERFEKSASDLELGLMKLEHALLNSTGDFSSLKNIDIDVIAHPIEELVCHINTIEEQAGFNTLESIADQSSLAMLKTLAQPIREIQEGVLQIQEQIALESSGKTPSGKSCAGILYEIAKPIRELRSGVALIQEQVIMEPDVEPLSEETRASSLQTFAVPIEEIRKVLTLITEQQPLLFEADVQSLSENISLLKTIAQPVKELQNKLASIEINELMESGVEPFLVKENILALAKPVQTLQEGIARIESQMALETIGDDLSLQNSVSVLKQIAQPLMEISKGIAIITEQQFIEEGHFEDVSSVSEFSTLANITDVSLADGAVHVGETIILEHGLSFQDNLNVPQLAKTAMEENLQVGVVEQQQVLSQIDSQIENNKDSIVKYERLDPGNLTLVQEVLSPLQVQEQEALSQARTFTVCEEKMPHTAELKEESYNLGVQGEFQDAVVHLEKFDVEKQVKETAKVQDVSLNTAVQVNVQEALSNAESLTYQENVQHMGIEPDTLTPCLVQGELQQSLADVESLETEEETLDSISIQDTSFKFEPHIIDVQQALSNVEDLTLTEKTLCEAEIKADIIEAVQNESLQALYKEANLESFDKYSEQANVSVNTPNVAAEIELQQIVSSLDIIETIKQPIDFANPSDVSLQSALQVECQQLLSNIESLKSESDLKKHSQVMALEESYSNVAVQIGVQEFFSVVEQIETAKNELKAKVIDVPEMHESVKEEVQLVLQAAEDIISIKEEVQAKSIEEPNVELPDIKQVLLSCEKVKHIKDTLKEKSKEHTEIKKDLENILSLAEKLQTAEENIIVNLPEESSISDEKMEIEKSFTNVESPGSLMKDGHGKISEGEPVAVPLFQSSPDVQEEHLSTSVKTLSDKHHSIDETVSQNIVETQLQQFITAVEDVSFSMNELQAKITSEPPINQAVQQEFQEILSAINDIKITKDILQSSAKQEQSFKLAYQTEIQQVLLACNHLETLKEAVEAKQSKESKVYFPIELELQQFLSMVDSFQSIKQTLTPNVTELEPLNGRVNVKIPKILSSNESELLKNEVGEVSQNKRDETLNKEDVDDQSEIRKDIRKEDETNKAGNDQNRKDNEGTASVLKVSDKSDEKEVEGNKEKYEKKVEYGVTDGVQIPLVEDKLEKKVCGDDNKKSEKENIAVKMEVSQVIKGENVIDSQEVRENLEIKNQAKVNKVEACIISHDEETKNTVGVKAEDDETKFDISVADATVTEETDLVALKVNKDKDEMTLEFVPTKDLKREQINVQDEIKIVKDKNGSRVIEKLEIIEMEDDKINEEEGLKAKSVLTKDVGTLETIAKHSGTIEKSDSLSSDIKTTKPVNVKKGEDVEVRIQKEDIITEYEATPKAEVENESESTDKIVAKFDKNTEVKVASDLGPTKLESEVAKNTESVNMKKKDSSIVENKLTEEITSKIIKNTEDSKEKVGFKAGLEELTEERKTNEVERKDNIKTTTGVKEIVSIEIKSAEGSVSCDNSVSKEKEESSVIIMEINEVKEKADNLKSELDESTEKKGDINVFEIKKVTEEVSSEKVKAREEEGIQEYSSVTKSMETKKISEENNEDKIKCIEEKKQEIYAGKTDSVEVVKKVKDDKTGGVINKDLEKTQKHEIVQEKNKYDETRKELSVESEITQEVILSKVTGEEDVSKTGNKENEVDALELQISVEKKIKVGKDGKGSELIKENLELIKKTETEKVEIKNTEGDKIKDKKGDSATKTSYDERKSNDEETKKKQTRKEDKNDTPTKTNEEEGVQAVKEDKILKEKVELEEPHKIEKKYEMERDQNNKMPEMKENKEKDNKPEIKKISDEKVVNKKVDECTDSEAVNKEGIKTFKEEEVNVEIDKDSKGQEDTKEIARRTETIIKKEIKLTNLKEGKEIRVETEIKGGKEEASKFELNQMTDVKGVDEKLEINTYSEPAKKDNTNTLKEEEIKEKNNKEKLITNKISKVVGDTESKITDANLKKHDESKDIVDIKNETKVTDTAEAKKYVDKHEVNKVEDETVNKIKEEAESNTLVTRESATKNQQGESEIKKVNKEETGGKEDLKAVAKKEGKQDKVKGKPCLESDANKLTDSRKEVEKYEVNKVKDEKANKIRGKDEPEAILTKESDTKNQQGESEIKKVNEEETDGKEDPKSSSSLAKKVIAKEEEKQDKVKKKTTLELDSKKLTDTVEAKTEAENCEDYKVKNEKTNKRGEKSEPEAVVTKECDPMKEQGKSEIKKVSDNDAEGKEDSKSASSLVKNSVAKKEEKQDNKIKEKTSLVLDAKKITDTADTKKGIEEEGNKVKDKKVNQIREAESEVVVIKEPDPKKHQGESEMKKVSENDAEGKDDLKSASSLAKKATANKEEKQNTKVNDETSLESDTKIFKVDIKENKENQVKSESKACTKAEVKKGKDIDEVKLEEGNKINNAKKEIKPDVKLSELSKTDGNKLETKKIKILKEDKGGREIEVNRTKIIEDTTVAKDIKSKHESIEKLGEKSETKDYKEKNSEEHLRLGDVDDFRKTVQDSKLDKDFELKNKVDTKTKFSKNKTAIVESKETDNKKRSSKKEMDKLILEERAKDIEIKPITTDSEVEENLIIVEKDENKHILFFDESSTSDYGSESYSESHRIKKSQSYDSRQWAYESRTEKATPRASKQVKEGKYEVSSPVEYEKITYTHRQSASKPMFCGRLVDRTAAQGTRLKVTCSLTGSPDPTVQWFKDGHPLDTTLDHRIHTRLSNGLASLEIVEAKVGDSGKYTCTARNTNGEASTTAHIKVFSYMESAPEAPVFTQQIRDHYKNMSDELVIECRVKGHPQPSVSWTKDGKPLRAISRYEQSVLTDGTCRLVIHGPEPADSGLYKCVAENTIWSEQTSAYVMFEGREKHLAGIRSLSDNKLPRFTNILSDTVVREGGTVALQVAIKGTPRAEVTWYRGSEPLPKRSSRFRYLEDAGVYSLVMTETSLTEAGTYTCRASNSHGYRDTSVNLEIVGVSGMSGPARGKPAMFVSRPDTSMGIAVGEDLSFSFRVIGDPKPRVTWMKGMKDITNNIRTLKETVNDYVRLTLKHTTIMDAGTYFIMAKNIYGADHAFVTVRVKQRARSLTPTRTTIWSAPDTSTILRDIHESTRALVNDVPGPVSSEPVVSDCGKNWLSLSWSKPEHRGAAPVLAYRVEAWLLGTEGGAQWNELGVTPINSFDVFFLKPGSEYKFRITARNRYGWGESVTSTEPISVGSVANFPPDIIRDLPGPLKALQGDNITLECEISGDPPPTIQWLRDGQNVGTLATLKGRVFVTDDQQIHRLIVKQLSEDDSGRYVCEAVNNLGRASTYSRLLVVTDPRLLDADRKLKESLAEQQEFAPQFTMRLRDRRVQATYPVRLSCQVLGTPTPSVTWAHQGQPITNGDRHQIMTEADHFHTLEISRTLLEDSGEYTAMAQNCLGAVSCHCQLIVDKGIRAYVSPEFISELSPAVTVREGAELRLLAQVEAYPTVSISWQRDGVRLRPSRRLVMTVDPEGRVELALAHLTVRDAGLYTCSATNAVGRAETLCQVFVTGGTSVAAGLPAITTSDAPYSKEPRFLTKPRSSEAVEGDTVVITCEVVGDPQPEVMWLRDWLKPGYYRDAPQFHQVAGGSQYSLEIPQVKLDFTGTYCVIARNPHGEAKAIISLQIYAKGQGKESSMVSGQVKHGQVETLPEIKRELRDLRCCDGDAVTLECLVSAKPLPSVRWEKDGRILPLGEDIEAELEGEVARLTIKKVYPEDEGQYSCVAYNDLGRAVTSACLVVDVPEEKETLLSQQLIRPPGLLSTRSTPRSTPRNTPSPARSISPTPARYREFSSPSFSRPKRIKMSSPKFYTVPHNRIAEEGETVRFQCSVAGHPTPWASWDKDGHIVTPSARLSVMERDDLRTLELREVTVEDAGLYRVTLENEMGSVEATARLDVIGRQGSRTKSVRAWSGVRASPTFGRRLVGSAARVGGTFTLTCDVHASPSPVTSWYRNGEMLVKSPRVVPSWDGRRARLELRCLQPEDAGVYMCVAENSVGTTQCSAELRVLQNTDPSDTDLQPPVFLQGLAPEQTAAEGQPFELQVRLQGSTPLEVVWVKDGVEVPDCPDLHHVDYGDGRFGLRIADVFMADGGIYNCEAFNDHGDAITSGHLIVNDMSGGEGGSTEPEIMFTKTPSPVLTRLRGQASFCARLQSRPLSHTSFTWTVNERSVNNDDRFTVTTEEDCSILHIGEVCPCDFGPVMCTARVCSPGVPPTTVSCDTTIGLDPSPGVPAVLLRGPCDTTAMRGDRVLLKATYRGDPEPSVRWLQAGRELSSEGRVQITSRDGVSCLTISSITADDSGKYVVSVENIHGADCHFASVAVEGPPEAPAARPSVTAAGEGCVTVAWSSPPYDGGCVITGYRVEMRTALSHQWSVVAERCHSLSHVVRGLTPGQAYLFRVRAENIHGASESSAESFPFTLQSLSSGLREEEGEGESDEALESKLVTLEPGDQFLERYSVHEELGKGRYGVVHKVTDLRTGHTMAAKFVRCIKKQDREKVQEEIDIMNCLRHPKLLQLAAAFENPKDMVMVMEYISGGELFERVVADDFTLTERDCILFLRQICEGVRYMHTCNVVHLDLKPENIMCHTRTSHRVKIIDFGLAQKLASNTPVRVLFGTPEFIPPEIINYEPIGVETDMWSVGVICYVLLSGLSPFMGDNDAETFANITRADFDFDDEAFEAISQDAKDFISSLLVKRKEKRLTAEECLKHKWLTQSDTTMNSVKLCTDKLKKFIIRRKWQKTGNAIRALGRMATLSAASRRNSSTSSPPSPRPSLSASRMSSLGEETKGDRTRGRVCSERSDSGISDCSSINTSATPTTPCHLLSKKYSICEEPENDSSSCRLTEHGVNVNQLCDGFNGKVTCNVSVAAKKRTTNSLRLDSEPAKAPSPTLQKDAKLFGKSENFQKAFAFWKQ